MYLIYLLYVQVQFGSRFTMLSYVLSKRELFICIFEFGCGFRYLICGQVWVLQNSNQTDPLAIIVMTKYSLNR